MLFTRRQFLFYLKDNFFTRFYQVLFTRFYQVLQSRNPLKSIWSQWVCELRKNLEDFVSFLLEVIAIIQLTTSTRCYHWELQNNLQNLQESWSNCHYLINCFYLLIFCCQCYANSFIFSQAKFTVSRSLLSSQLSRFATAFFLLLRQRFIWISTSQSKPFICSVSVACCFSPLLNSPFLDYTLLVFTLPPKF